MRLVSLWIKELSEELGGEKGACHCAADMGGLDPPLWTRVWNMQAHAVLGNKPHNAVVVQVAVWNLTGRRGIGEWSFGAQERKGGKKKESRERRGEEGGGTREVLNL
jgi:hypothetical protein